MKPMAKSEKEYLEMCKKALEKGFPCPVASTDISREDVRRIYNQAAMLVFGSKWKERQKEIDDFYEPLDEGEPFERRER